MSKIIDNIIKNRILPALSGNYQINNNYVIKLSIKDILVGFFFERSSTEDFYYVWWFSLPLYIPNDILHFVDSCHDDPSFLGVDPAAKQVINVRAL
jgi:hypothetical protein